MQLARLQTRRILDRHTGDQGMVRTHRMPTTSVYTNLQTVVIRLLAVALWQTGSRPTALPRHDLPLPGDYRSWPVVETEGMPQSGGEWFKCYVCAKGAATPDDEPFPVGTLFVIETYRSTRRSSCHTSVPSEVEQEPARVFVMKKYATVQWRGDGAPKNEAWACALYGGRTAKPDIV